MSRPPRFAPLALAVLLGLAGSALAPAARSAAPGKTAKASSSGYPYKLASPSSIKIKPFHFNPPEPRREVLSNGMVLYVMEDHELPIVNVSAYVKTGSLYDPAGKSGLAGLTAATLRTGGTTRQTGDEIDQALDFVGASLGFGAYSSEILSAGGTSLVKDSDLLIRTLADILQHPVFADNKLELARNQALEGIRRQNDEPQAIAQRQFKRLVYGASSPWAQTPTLASVRSITRQDLIDFHRRYFHPNDTILAIAGDFKADDMLAKLRNAFGDWEKASIDYPKIAPLQDIRKSAVYVVNKDVPQTVIWMGHLGYRRGDPNRPAIEVMNQILGQGPFTSRLMQQVRSDRGYAYSVWGGSFPGTDRGMFYAEAESKTESAIPAAKLMDQIIAQMKTNPPSEAEVKSAKEQILNSYVFQFASPFGIVDQRATFEMLGYPRDYMKTYPEAVRKVTPADVKAAALKYLHPDRMVMLLVGNESELKPGFSKLGSVTELPLDNPAGDDRTGPADRPSNGAAQP
jgi:predicted Zn-dependent peptidase